MSQRRPFEDIYPLSPMQEGMLFHSRYEPASGVYFCQSSCRLQGNLEPAALERAWQSALDAHPALRTAFDWRRRDRPFQIVYRQARLPWRQLDWRDLPVAEVDGRFEQLMAEDRTRGFDLDRPPLMRCTLVRTGERQHRFVWSVHHLVVDGWCQGLVLQQVFEAYAAALQGEGIAVRSSPPYRHYIGWLQSQSLAKAEEFWRQELRGVRAATPLGIDRPAAESTESDATPSASGYEQREFRLSSEESAAIQAWLRSAGLTLSTWIQGAWGLLLQRFSGDDDVVFGATVSGRPPSLPDVESIVGLFINTLPVRVRIEGQRPWSEWLTDLQARQLEARGYEYSPLVEVQGWSEVPRGQPLFESLVIVETFPFNPGASATTNGNALVIEDLRSFDRVSYPLGLQVVPGEQITLRLKFDSDRFTADAIEHALEQLVGLCRQALANPSQPLRDFSLLTPEARIADPGQVLAPPIPPTLPQLFEEVVERRAEAVALTLGDRHYSYQALERASRAIADRVVRGEARGQAVAVTGPRGIGRIAAMLAVLRGGGILLTLDPRLPARRRRRMLELADARRLIAVGAAPDAEVTADLPLVLDLLDEATGLPMVPEGEAQGEAPELPRPAPGDSAYIFFTSGTSGEPRGVLGRHAGLGHFLDWQRRNFDVSGGDRAAQLTGLSFDVVLRDVFLPLVSGATLDVPECEPSDAGKPLPWLDTRRITRLHSVPAVAHGWLEEAPEGVELATLRTIFFAGEPLTASLVERFRQAYPRVVELINLYGPTETTLAKCWYRVPSPPDPGVQPVGRAMPGAQVLVASAGGRRCGVGEVGEIVIRTPFRTLGYVTDPDETQRRFMANPFRDEADDLIYRTGDRGRFRADGVLEILGRIDDQLKVRGVRVEPAEVTATLERHPAVASAIVVGRRDPRGEPALVAYIVPSGNLPSGEPDVASWRDFLSRRLPAAAVPSSFGVLERLPLTANGKVDRKALPAPSWDDASGTVASKGSQNPFEEMITDIFRQVLRRDAVSAQDDFFELGGHSLLATQVISRLRRASGVEIELAEFFEQPTVANLATAVAQKWRAGSEGVDALPLQRRDDNTTAPLSFAQERLWFLDRLQPGSAVYNIHQASSLEGPLHVGALHHALKSGAARHEVLRTAFTAEKDGRSLARIAADVELPLPVIDLSRLPESRRSAELRALGPSEAARPFDLNRPPLLRVMLVVSEPRHHTLLFTLHHIVADAWSLGLLIREVGEVYEASLAGRPAPLKPLAIQYGDFAAHQRQRLQGDTLKAMLESRRQRLAGIPSLLELPTDRSRPTSMSFRGARVLDRWPADLLRRLEALARGCGATLFMVLLAGLQTLLHRLSGHRQMVIGTPVAGRHRVEIEDLVGFFVNTLALEGEVTTEPFLRQLDAARKTLLSAYADQELPFEKLLEELGVERNLAHNPLFQVMLVVQNAPEPETLDSQLVLRPLESEVGTARLDLTISCTEENGELVVLTDYATDLFDATTVRRWLGHLRQLLTSAVEDANRSVATLSALASSERHQLLREWNDSEVRHPSDRCLHDLFASWATSAPESVVATLDDQFFSYGEVAIRARRLAAHLRQQGADPGATVAIVMDRSPEMLIGLLAILEAGAAFVPLDPDLPAERLQGMLEDTEVDLMLTDRDGRIGTQRIGTRVRQVVLERRSDAAWNAGTPASNVFDPDGLAYMIFTSGSTGRPKGVMVAHRGVVNTLDWRRLYLDLRPEDCFLQNIPLSFDPSVWQIFGALMCGARLVLVSAEDAKDPARVLPLMVRQRVTITDFPPSLLRQLVDRPEMGQAVYQRHLFAGGEALPPAVRDAFAEVSNGHLHNIYGPTEGSIDASCWTCDPAPRPGPVPIGRPIANKAIRVHDRELQPTPPGVAGELCIGGDGLAWGYRGRPARSARSWVPDVDGVGGRLYRTGDLVRYLPDGVLRFLGRIDHQVKVRGVRIELGEVEAALRAFPSVGEAVVLAVPGASGDNRLEGYVTSKGEIDPASLHEHLVRSLPRAMVPAVLRRVAEVPRSPAGKVDRQKLVRLPSERLAVARPFEETQTVAEARLAEIWCEVLGLEQVGRADNFFELGGDSISSIQIVARAAQHGLRLAPRQLFEHQTVAALAAVAEHGAAVQAEQGAVTGELPLTPIQRWFFDAGPETPHHFNQSLMLSFEQTVDVGQLAAAVATLTRHHDALRLRFHHGGGDWQQQNAGFDESTPFVALDLSRLASDRRQGMLEAAADTLQKSLDLARGPILRAAFFQLGDGGSRLLLAIHHLAIDGVSWRVLLEDLHGLLTEGASYPLPAKTSSFRDWARALANHARSDELEQELDHWRAVPPQPLPLLPRDLSDGEGSTEDGIANLESMAEEVSTTLTEDETRELLEKVPAVYRTRVDELLLAGLFLTFAEWTGQRSLLVELEGHGREDLFETLDTSRTVGWFTTTYPVYLAAGSKDPVAVLQAVKEQLRKIPGHGIGYGLLRYLGGPQAQDLARLQAPEVSFNYLGRLDGTAVDGALFAPAPESDGALRSSAWQRRHLLEISGQVAAGRLGFRWRYSRRLHRRQTIKRLADGMSEALRSILTAGREPKASTATPTDFPLIRTDQQQLNRLMQKFTQGKAKG